MQIIINSPETFVVNTLNDKDAGIMANGIYCISTTKVADTKYTKGVPEVEALTVEDWEKISEEHEIFEKLNPELQNLWDQVYNATADQFEFSA